MCSSEPFASTRRFLFKSVFENHFICVPRSPSRLRGIFGLNPLKTNTNVPLIPLCIYDAFSIYNPYQKTLQMRPLEPFASTRHFLLKSLIKRYYICAPRNPSRLRGDICLNLYLKFISYASLGPLRVYEEISFQAPFKRTLQMRPSDYFASLRHFRLKSKIITNAPLRIPSSPSRLRRIFFVNPLLKTNTNVPLGSDIPITDPTT